MRKVILASALALTTALGCSELAKWGGSSRASAALSPDGYAGPVQTLASIPSTATVPAGCVRVEGETLGEFATLSIGARTVTFTAWSTKAEKEYVRFSFVASGPVVYAVKAGIETYRDNVLLWAPPEGLAASAISNITFCAAPAGSGGAVDGGIGSVITDPGGEIGAGYGGAACTGHGQCWSGECFDGQCLPGWSFDYCVDGQRDCLSGECTVLGCAPIPDGERGSPCTAHFRCWSGACIDGTCQGGDIGDACRSSDDCQIGYLCDDANTQTCLPSGTFTQ